MADVQFGIRRAGTHVNLADLHVEHRQRIRNLFNEAIASGLGALEVYSGARTRAHQTQLYTAFLQRGRAHPVVASPTYKSPSTGRVGSAHQVQLEGQYQHGNLRNDRSAAYAADIRWASRVYPGSVMQSRLHTLARSNGLYPSVSTEWWHFVPIHNSSILAVVGWGHRGPAVLKLQQDMNVLLELGGGQLLVEDGQYGPATMRAVADWQRENGRPVSGDYTVADRAKLEQQVDDSKLVNAPDEVPFNQQMRRALRRIGRRGDDALEMFEEGADPDEIRKMIQRSGKNVAIALELVKEL